MRYLLLALVLLVTGCQAGFNAGPSQPQQSPYYEYRFDPYTGQRIR